MTKEINNVLKAAKFVDELGRKASADAYGHATNVWAGLKVEATYIYKGKTAYGRTVRALTFKLNNKIISRERLFAAINSVGEVL